MDNKHTVDLVKLQQVKSQDIVLVLQNALNYGAPWNVLYQACIEEILELRNQLVNSGQDLKPVQNFDGSTFPVLSIDTHSEHQ